MKYNIIILQEHPSSNLYIKQNYQSLQEYTVINVINQTAGRGREQRKWESQPNTNLTFSIYLKPKICNNQLPLISLIVGASLFKTINKYIKCSIKWPNDIIVNDKKIAGILVESIYSNELEALVCGVGININQEMFSKDLIIKATSLKNELGYHIDKDIVLNDFLKEFSILYEDFLIGKNHFITICKENNYLKNKEVYYDNKKIKVIDISEKGNLVVLENNQIKELFYGEVTLKNTYKGVNDAR